MLPRLDLDGVAFLWGWWHVWSPGQPRGACPSILQCWWRDGAVEDARAGSAD